MKYSVSPPPQGRGDVKDDLDSIISWLYILNEALDAVLENLGTENFNSEVNTLLKERGSKD